MMSGSITTVKFFSVVTLAFLSTIYYLTQE
jgi:hypothetical protein